jgi:hypothetical protein
MARTEELSMEAQTLPHKAPQPPCGFFNGEEIDMPNLEIVVSDLDLKSAEIERLRKALDEIFKYCIEDGDDVGTIALIRDTADKALTAAK